MQSRLNGHAPVQTQADQESPPTHERVGFAFDLKQWDMVSGLAVQLLEGTQRSFLEHALRLTNTRNLAQPTFLAEMLEEVASNAANQAFSTARHFIAHQVLNAERIARAAAEAEDAARREVEARRRESLGLPPDNSIAAYHAEAKAGDGDGDGTTAQGDSGSVIQTP